MPGQNSSSNQWLLLLPTQGPMWTTTTMMTTTTTTTLALHSRTPKIADDMESEVIRERIIFCGIARPSCDDRFRTRHFWVCFKLCVANAVARNHINFGVTKACAAQAIFGITSTQVKGSARSSAQASAMHQNMWLPEGSCPNDENTKRNHCAEVNQMPPLSNSWNGRCKVKIRRSGNH